MRFDQALKKVIETNILLFEHYLKYFLETPGPQHQFLASVAKVGWQNNYFMRENLKNMEFIPGDEESAEAEERIIGEATETIDQAERIIQPKQLLAAENAQSGDAKDLAELDKIFNAPEHPVVNIKELINGSKPDGSGELQFPEPRILGTDARDWYNRIFPNKAENKPPEGFPGKDDKGTDGPEVGPSEEGQ